MRPVRVLAVLVLVLSTGALASDSRGFLRIETRAFEYDGNAATTDFGFGMSGRLEYSTELNDFQIKARAFARVDERDRTRNLFISEEAFIAWKGENLELSFGSRIFNWSATEAFHPADILNSRNWDSNLENAEKFGEPALQVLWLHDTGSVQVALLPVFVKPRYPGTGNRLSFVAPGTPVASAQAYTGHSQIKTDYVSQWMFKADFNLDDLDIAFHFVDHIDRTQPVIVNDSGFFRQIFIPVSQAGFTVQWVLGDWVIKSEIAHRNFRPQSTPLGTASRDDHGQVATGLEYGWTSDSGKDSTLILETQHIVGITRNSRLAMGMFQNDVLLGYRFAFNDIASQELFFSVIADLERDNEILFTASYSRRLSDTWKLHGGIRVIEAPQKGATPTGLEPLDGSNQVYLDLSRYF
jgi:hypothetical protein